MYQEDFHILFNAVHSVHGAILQDLDEIAKQTKLKSASHLHILFIVVTFETPVTPTQISRIMNQHFTTVLLQLRWLEEHQYVEIRKGTKDGRTNEVIPTTKGVEKVKQLILSNAVNLHSYRLIYEYQKRYGRKSLQHGIQFLLNYMELLHKDSQTNWTYTSLQYIRRLLENEQLSTGTNE
ncbi:MarR family winged helix-turn-helix transcriptional regulator [Rubeoparvulum massiliense]|uniref:MarR family winged helix-turn-helix transcriptional regulator n=1 Tax=Rubeoparvulum massiliense TaxID=1631346 RepID=UPI00065DFC3C|nr:MarR family transcriptional regulator [Rubeoparvulum massiliense]